MEEKLGNFRQIDLAIAREREKENGPEARAEAMLRHSEEIEANWQNCWLPQGAILITSTAR